MFICKWEPMDEYGNATGPDIDSFSFFFGIAIGLVIGVFLAYTVMTM